jgi:hypothetical protein
MSGDGAPPSSGESSGQNGKARNGGGADGAHDLHVALATAHVGEEAWTEAARHWLTARRWGEAAHAIR